MVAARNAWEGFAGRGGSLEFGRRSWQRAVEATDWTRVLIEARGIHARREHEPAGDDLTCGECIKDVLLVRNWPREAGVAFRSEYETEHPFPPDRGWEIHEQDDPPRITADAWVCEKGFSEGWCRPLHPVEGGWLCGHKSDLFEIEVSE